MPEEQDFAILQVEFQHLKEKVDHDDLKFQRWIREVTVQFEKRDAERAAEIAILKDANKELNTKLRIGKGILGGIVLTLGSIGFVAYDKLREGMLTAMKIIS